MEIKPKDLGNKYPYISSGREGDIYKYSYDTAIKIIRIIRSVDVDSQLGIKNNSYSFPIEKVYVNNVFHGYTREFIYGDTMDKIQVFDLPQFLILLHALENDTIELSRKYKLLIGDLSLSNVMLSNNQLKVIDTSMFIKIDEIDEEQIINLNLRTIKKIAKKVIKFHLSKRCKLLIKE